MSSKFEIGSEFAMTSMGGALNDIEQWTELSLDCAFNRNHCKFTADFKLLAHFYEV